MVDCDDFDDHNNIIITLMTSMIGMSGLSRMTGMTVFTVVAGMTVWSAIILFQNYDTIYMRFFPTCTCNHSCYTITCVFLSRILAFYSQVYDHFLTNGHYICAQKSPYISVTNKHVVYAAAESRHIRGTELYRQQKTPSCTMELKSNLI